MTGRLSASDLVRAWCEEWTRESLPVPEQLTRLRLRGVIIGGGAAGPDASVPPCAYCGASGGGGHGGLCPNAGRTLMPVPAWMADLAEAVTSYARLELAGRMALHEEDPEDAALWALRAAQLQAAVRRP